MFSYMNRIYSKLYYICFCMYLSSTSVFDPICVLHLILLGLRVWLLRRAIKSGGEGSGRKKD